MSMHIEELYTIQDGCFGYSRELLFKNLCFGLQKGKFYGLIGPNGSGKSTLIDLLMGTKSLSSGMITFNDRPLGDYSRRELALHLSLVPQRIGTGFDFSVYDIVMMGRHPHIPRFKRPSSRDLAVVENVLQLLDIHHLKDRPAANLSGGEKQRVIVARALAQETQTIMLDEATSNLDIEHTLGIMRVLRNKVLYSDCTVIAAIHDLNLAAAFCDELVVLKNGTVFQKGPIHQVVTADLLRQVFSVNGKIIAGPHYPRIEYQMHGSFSE